MRYFLYVFLFFLILGGCRQKIEEDNVILQNLTSPAGANSSLPFLYANVDRTLLSWVEQVNDSLTALKYSELANGKWTASEIILQDSDWFVNWADFPAIAENKGNLISHVLKKSSAGTYSYDVKLHLLKKGGHAWKTNLPLHTDNTPTEHGFVSVLPYKEGFFITWLDGRNTEEDESGNRGAMTLRAAEVSPTGEISNEREIDNRICDCCQTTAVITSNGPAVLYRDRSEEEIRDISIVRWLDGQWIAPKTVFADNWEIKGCPVNGPKASVRGNTLVMAWFTGVGKKPKVQAVFSANGGTDFENPITVSENHAMGRVDVQLLNEGEAIVSWMESHDDSAQLRAVKVYRDGTLGKKHLISKMAVSRQSGFPQMEQVGDKIFFAWTEVGDATSEVKTAFIAVDRF